MITDKARKLAIELLFAWKKENNSEWKNVLSLAKNSRQVTIGGIIFNPKFILTEIC